MPAPKKDATTRAQEALAVAERRVMKLKAKHEKLGGELNTVAVELRGAKKRRDYLAQDPDLKHTPDDAEPDKSFESSHKAEDQEPEF